MLRYFFRISLGVAPRSKRWRYSFRGPHQAQEGMSRVGVMAQNRGHLYISMEILYALPAMMGYASGLGIALVAQNRDRRSRFRILER